MKVNEKVMDFKQKCLDVVGIHIFVSPFQVGDSLHNHCHRHHHYHFRDDDDDDDER